jgi:hypothetical protein
MPDARPCRSEGVLNRRSKCPRSPKTPKKILNRGNELKDLLKPKGLAFFTQQNELVFERPKQPLKLKSTFQTAGKPRSRRQGSGVGEALTCAERNSERVLNRRPKCPSPPENPKKILNRGNELKDLLKPKGLAFFKQQNELVFERPKQRLKPKSTVPRTLRAKSQAPRLGCRGKTVTSEERNFKRRTVNREPRISLPRYQQGVSPAHNH